MILGPSLTHSLATCYPTRAVCVYLLGDHADWVLIGAWNPMLWPIWGFRLSAIPAGFATSTTILNLGYNAITTIEPAALARYLTIYSSFDTGFRFSALCAAAARAVC